MIRRYITYTILFGLTIALLGCGDSSTDSDSGEGDPPSVPTDAVENSQPDLSYFNKTSKVSNQRSTSTNFISAQTVVLGFGSLAKIGQIYTSYFEEAQGNNASYNNGLWEWEYSYSTSKGDGKFRLTAEDGSNGYNWDMFITVNSSKVSVNDYNIVSGFVAQDGKSGNWTFNAMPDGSGSENALLETSWQAVSSSESEIDITVYNDQGSNTDITYTEDGDVHTMNISSSSKEVYWNEKKDIGYFKDGQGAKKCWSGSGSSATNVSCSTVNL